LLGHTSDQSGQVIVQIWQGHLPLALTEHSLRASLGVVGNEREKVSGCKIGVVSVLIILNAPNADLIGNVKPEKEVDHV
jgi:hypothetical protein